MKFSVLIPVYNAEKYIDDCINSILSQTYRNFEIVLVDDGSTDGSADICDRYQNEYPDIIRVIHQENQGQLLARINAIKVAQGDYCIFMDADDYVSNGLLQEIYNSLVERETDVVIYSYRCVRDGIHAEYFKRIADDYTVWSGEKKKELYEKLLLTNEVTTVWTKAVKTEVLKKDPTDYTVFCHKNMAEDLMYSMAIFTYADTISYIYRPLYMYRINDGSVSRNYRLQTLNDKNTIHVYYKAKEYMKIWGIDDEIHNKQVDARWFNDVMCMFSRYLESAKGKKERREVFAADWGSLMPSEIKDIRNEFENKVYQKLYYLFQCNNFKAANRYILKKRIVKKLKHIKSTVMRKKNMNG